MSTVDFAKYKKTLVEQLAELSVVVQNREGIGIERNADARDEVQGAAERELAICNLDQGSQLLQHGDTRSMKRSR